jgi:RNA recognition motif-containing protein
MLLEFFNSRIGQADSARVVTDPSTGYSKGFGYVIFNNYQACKEALKLDGQMILSLPIELEHRGADMVSTALTAH